MKVWEAGDRMCGKLLAAVLPALVAGLERHGELRLDGNVREALVSMSAATIDRQLRSWRKRLGRQPPAAGFAGDRTESANTDPHLERMEGLSSRVPYRRTWCCTAVRAWMGFS